MKCYFCGEEKKDANRFMPQTKPICDSCFRKAMKYFLEMSNAWIEEKQRRRDEQDGQE